MDCRELEGRLEALLDGELSEPERRRCEGHLEGCPSCRELVEPLRRAAAPPDDLVDAVLARTSGPACGRAEEQLCGWLDGELAATERRLVEAHLDSCDGCRALAAAVSRLRAELPRLAELRPDPGFVGAVLRATLPPRVQLRRWWAATWPRWVRRPRFASETAFIATLVLAVVVATPGSPLAALPTRALDLARTDPLERLGAPLEALEEGFATQVRKPLGARYADGAATVLAWARAAEERGRGLAAEAGDWIGTSRDRLASLLSSADKKATDGEDAAPNPTQETP